MKTRRGSTYDQGLVGGGHGGRHRGGVNVPPPSTSSRMIGPSMATVQDEHVNSH